jgi:nifR3 family TIM-barrel protein
MSNLTKVSEATRIGSPAEAGEDFLKSNKPLQFGPLTLTSRFLLSPLAGYTNLAFRLAIREIGGLGLATTDLVNARALIQGGRRTLELIQTCPEDRPVAVQIYGADAGEMREAAQWLETYGISGVDINMGCPVHKVVRGGGGSAMMCDPAKTIDLVREVVSAVRIPVSVKMRLGWDDAGWSAPFFARKFEEAGVAAVIIHGRTREQGFSGSVNLDGIKAVVEAVERIPVIGNGDVRTIPDALQMIERTGCTGISIGRGALLNPWIFTQLHNWELTGEPGRNPTYDERLKFMTRHFHLLVEQRGERFGCLTFRKVANWYCKVLRPGREIQQSLVRLDSTTLFDQIVSQMGENPVARRGYETMNPLDLSIPTPSGPNERW